MPKNYSIVGLMSGTSLDGLDLAHCHIIDDGTTWSFQIKKSKSVPYTLEMQTKLKDSIYLSADELLCFHNEYGTWLGEQAGIFIGENELAIDCIASHGHTTHHQPEKGLTFQIGSGQHLANASGCKVVCDFRTNDVALGGQGAPLVPIGDQLFFNAYDFCLNLGGISNISFVKNGQRLAFDIGLANMVLNHITRKNNLDYDEGGKLAQSGQVNVSMLDQLNSLEFYSLPHPKSIGYEWFVKKVVPIVDKTADSMENLLCTAIHHIVQQIAFQIEENSSRSKNKVLVTGGGALNDFLISTLSNALGPTTEVVVPSKQLIEFKEALVFALMGALRLEEKINVLCAVTGAKNDSSSGVVFLPN
ncbi:anhydro-N-acetylmuramic acid kinase [Pareuzebyella sediminis]|uniref:anhydro-N-acetylmuramic acid kinase n=1 Tax=Pareuzebyella sediminis TaxID=2607998 RepID=UPI0011EEC6A5|nr:anhydro-N-acetylmuramic acid kinase [Pareuzebyella sediminis]